MLQLLQVVVPVESCGREDLWSSLSRKLRCVLDNWQFLRLRTENTRDVQRNLATLRFRTLWEEPLIQLLRMLLCRLANQCKLLIHVDSLGDSSFDSYLMQCSILTRNKATGLTQMETTLSSMQIPPAYSYALFWHRGQSINCRLEGFVVDGFQWKHSVLQQ